MIDIHHLDGIDLFAKLSPEERRAVAESMSIRSFEANQPIVWIGDAASEFYIIVAGSVEICMPDQSGRELQMGVMHAGEYFGELALFDEGVRSSTARSVEPVQLLVLTHSAFHACLRAHPSIAIRLLEVIGRRQRQLLSRMRSIGNVNEIIQQKLTRWQRVTQFIADLAASRGFLLVHATAFLGWIIANVVLGRGGWDPYPFSFLCFWASVEAIFLSLFILVSQSMQSQKDRVRNEQDYQIAVKMQYELSTVQQKLDRLLDRGPPRE
jgi:CRP-like cAMP-binding protein